MIRRAVRQLSAFFKKWLWTKPTAKPEPFKATEVQHLYTCIKYNGQWINLKKTDIPAFTAMARTDKRGMAQRFRQQVKKGHIKFVEVNGTMTCIKNKDYEKRAINR